MMSKGFKNDATTWVSKTSVSDAAGGADDGVSGEGEQSPEPGES